MRINIDENIVLTIGTIAEKENFEVYAVGGFVRDKLLNKSSIDIDFVVVGDAIAFAERCKTYFKRCKVVIYQRFKTASLTLTDYKIEFVSARSESYIENSRNPIVVETDLKSDLSRRDFTINAMAVKINGDEIGEVIDYFDGLKHLKMGLIKTPLAPKETYSDDPLRMLRAIRFATRFDYKIEEESWKAIKTQAYRLSIISVERVTDEFFKILSSEYPSRGVELLDQSGLLVQFMPELTALKSDEVIDGYGHKNIFNHTMKVLSNLSSTSTSLKLRLASLLHDIGKPEVKYFKKGIGWSFHGHEDKGSKIVKTIAKRLKWSLDLTDYLSKIVLLHHRPIALSQEGVTDSGVRRLLFEGNELVEDLMLLCRADITTGNEKKLKEYLTNFDTLSKLLISVEEKDRLRNFKPPLDGEYIMSKYNLKPGKIIGILKQGLIDAIINNEIENTHQAAEEFISMLYQKTVINK